MSGDGTRPGETDPAVRAVRMAGDYLTRVARWLSRRRAFGASLLDNPLLSRRLAAALVDLRAAQAVLATRPGADPAAEAERRAVAVHGAAACVERCAEVHAGAGVFDPAPDAVREIRYRLADRQPPNGPYERWPGPPARLTGVLADGLRAAITGTPPGPHDGWVRGLIAGVERVSPVATASLREEVTVAEVLAASLPSGPAAHVMTHRQVVRSYLTGPGTASAAPGLLERAREGRALVAVAVTEPDSGSDLSGMRTRLRGADGSGRLDGVKTYVTGGAGCDLVLVAAREESRTVLGWIDADSPGVSRRALPSRAWQGVGFAELTFRGCPLPAERRHRGEGMTALLTGLVTERLILAAHQLAHARHRLADLPAPGRTEPARRLAAAQCLLEATLTGADGAPGMAEASMVKFACCAVAAEVTAARTAALAGRPGHPSGPLLDDEAGARAACFAGGTADVALAVAGGQILSLIAAKEGEHA
ncbi:acyl-CoA dehydrogenase family protein [Streptomyces carpaticus]|uniref:acyl-CoA dehydrogenase family protein n=1 Tax=Streptomyces carpaticus TaxID=285558 RepID=UPI00220CB902|nr:acyl-CoA dehydrogenase family protein [Streptomyces carpaticus]